MLAVAPSIPYIKDLKPGNKVVIPINMDIKVEASAWPLVKSFKP
jgi:hypothetical protein